MDEEEEEEGGESVGGEEGVMGRSRAVVRIIW
jgi:hypothetical protein